MPPSSQCQRIVLLACGSFNPPTIMHLRMFELARDYFRKEYPTSIVVGGVISPTHDSYQKKSLIHSSHRLEMSRRSTICSSWIKVSDWEARQNEWTRTRMVMDNYSDIVQTSSVDWLPTPGSSDQGPIILKLLCGADLLESFSVPGLWKTDDILRIVQDYGIVVITREGSNPEEYIQNSSTLRELAEHIHIVQDWISNDGKNEK
ncbi:nicotinamide/nicotinic acid mononucleotide adenylyltransferase 2 isoform X2 [Eurytemora carolleeae]|uniref:nicotinamide/nicotinic acid mononucleotide adenylyltransferase 2 isoform X2 n=1 Tax=Eurytemora carolleeae TaxID=1294199 RepID=UPI000C780F5E|nr:nicotinamide/nicotinic acid mononucleotide adenylyltransferase 2 isoform X2 [Eurytemora carolleeae]|eukprot:XP_023337682.1 nicotinamide/nicotinic acid mononucleotide adenylyltransferase 2-like isoform X2 [Eurytemora affinis]